MDRDRVRFLFKADQGAIDAPTWRFHAGWLVGATVAATGVWLVLSPFAHHDLRTSAFIAPMTILAFTYLIVFSFAVLLVAISFYNLSAKRLRDRGEPTGLAGLVPFLALLSGALHFIQPQIPDEIAVWYVVGIDIVLAAAIVWTVVDLGFTAGTALARDTKTP